jgi:hypothetical protein
MDLESPYNNIAQAENSSALKEVAFKNLPTEAKPEEGTGIFTITADGARIKHTGGLYVHLTNTEEFSLQNGEMLIEATRPMAIDLAGHRIELGKGTIALISKKDNMIAVQNLVETHGHSLKVLTGSHSTSIASGQEVMLAADVGDITMTMRKDLIGRRNVKFADTSNNMKVMSCDVSLLSLMQGSYLVNRIVRSEESTDKQVAGKLFKMTACLGQVTARKGIYTPQTGQ